MSTTTTRRKHAVRAQADPVLHRRAEIRSLAKRTVEDIIKMVGSWPMRRGAFRMAAGCCGWSRSSDGAPTRRRTS